MKIVLGPPGSGKTTTLLNQVVDNLKASKAGLGRRVWWVGLPHQRPHVMRRLTSEASVVMGVEFMSSQQLYMRLLTINGTVYPPMPNTERIALVGSAISRTGESVPGPGEANLYAAAIAEAKRHNLGPGSTDVDGDAPAGYREVFAGSVDALSGPSGLPASVEDFRRVFKQYEFLKFEQGKFDYDDFRIHTHHLLTTTRNPEVEPDLIVVDGFRTFTRLELSIFEALSAHAEVVVSASRLPEGFEATEELPAREAAVTVHEADNPIDELRFVMRSIKGDLANGLDPLEVGLVAPERDHSFIQALAREYGVPLMPASSKSLARTPAGGLFVDLLTYPDAPNPSKLERLPGLTELAITTRREGLTGLQGVEYVAEQLGVLDLYREWFDRLFPPVVEKESGDDPREVAFQWAATLIEALPEIDPVACQDGWDTYRELLRLRAREATHLGVSGEAYRQWLISLIRETPVPTISNGAVALVTANQASGVQFTRAYVTSAIVGAYSAKEREDFFVTEEWRGHTGDDSVFLPRRFQGLDELLYRELRTRAPEVTITFAGADQNTRYHPEPGLIGNPDLVTPLPVLPAGSAVELLGYKPFEADSTFPKEDLPRTVQALKNFSDCAVKYWAGRHLRTDEPDWWRKLVRELTQHQGEVPAEVIDRLKGEYPIAADWLEENRELLLSYKFGVRIPKAAPADGVVAIVDAAQFAPGGKVTLVHFTEPGRVADSKAANRVIYDRWNELYAAGVLFTEHANVVSEVSILVWPVLGEPFSAYEFNSLRKPAADKLENVRSALPALANATFTPTPGYYCTVCQFASVCRKDA